MTRLRWVCATGLMALAGCTFDEKLPASIVVTCGPNGECPRGRSCNVDTNECMADSNVGDTPVLTASAPAPAVARRGATVTFNVTSSIALGHAPRVQLRHTTGTTSAGEPTTAAADFTQQTYSVVIDERFAEGLVTLFADAVTPAGATANGVKLESFLTDFSGPTLRSSQVSPAAAAPGAAISIAAEFDEALTDDVRLHVQPANGAPSFLLSPDSNRGGRVAFTLVVPATAADGEWQLTLQSLSDLAGNTAADVSLHVLTVDSRLPTIGGLGLRGRRFSAVPGFNSFTVPIAVDEVAAIELCVADRSCQDVDAGVSVDVTVTTADSEGPQTVAVRAVDASGNQSIASEPVAFDFTAPGLVASVVSPQSIHAGSLVTVRAEFDESLADEVRLSVTPVGAAEQLQVPTSNRAGVVTFTFTIPSGAPDGTWALALRNVKDVTANAAAVVALPGVMVDAQPPVVGALGLRGRHFSAQAGFNTFSVPINVNEAATVQVCVGDRPCQAATVGTAVNVTVTTSDSEGPQFIVVTATDAAGNQTTVSEAVVYDFTAPGISGTATDQITPPLGCPLQGVTALAAGAGHQLRFAADEHLGATPIVTSGGFAWTLQSSTSNGFVFGLTVPPTGVSQVQDVTAHVVDDVGNFADLVVRSALSIDVVAPGPLSAVDQDRLLYQRIPWGADESANAVRYSVVGSAGLLNPGESLVFLDGPTVSSSYLGQVRALGDGSFSRLTFSNADRQKIWAVRYDGACNASAAGPQTVTNIEWVATTGQPTGASTNPHQAQLRETGQQPAEISSFTSAGTAWATRTAAPTSLQVARGEWNVIGGLAPPPALTGRLESTMAYDSLRGLTVLFGGQGAGAVYLAETWVHDGTSWTQRPTPPAMLGRAYSAMVYDSKRARMVLFGGNNSTELNDTWVFDGSTWKQLPTPTGLTARARHSMAYDVAGDRVVLFTGLGVTSPAETWVLEGNAWRKLTGPGPASRANYSLEYDSLRGRVVLFGGYSGLTYFNDTWILSGNTWTQIATPPALTGRSHHRAVFDTARGTMVVFGGENQTAPFNETWELSGSTWTQVTSPPGLTARSWHSMAYDAARRRVVLFGGLSSTTFLGDSWALDAGGWRPLVTPSAINARTQASLSFDAARGRMVLFGGAGGSMFNDTWYLDGSGWQSGSPPLTLAARYQHAMAYDSKLGRLVLNGGRMSTQAWTNDTWVLDGNGWAPVTTPVALAARSMHPLQYDPDLNRTVLFAGANNSRLSDSWALSNNTWTQIPTPGIAPRVNFAMAYDSQLHRFVVVGGSGNTASFADAWVLDAAGWSALTPPTMTARAGATMVWDVGRSRLVMFGGQGNETWSLVGSTWTQLASAPPARINAQMLYDPTFDRVMMLGGQSLNPIFNDAWALTSGWSQVPTPANYVLQYLPQVAHDSRRGRIVVFGNSGSSGGLNDTWILRGSTWSQIPTPAALSGRFFSTLVDDRVRGRVVLFGGYDVGTATALNDAWALETSAASGPANAVRIDTSTLLPSGALVTSVTASVPAAGLSAITTSTLPANTTLLPNGLAAFNDGGTLSNPDGGSFFPAAVAVSGARLETWDTFTGRPFVLAQNSVSTRSADGGLAVGSDGGAVAAQWADLTATLSQQSDGGDLDGGNSSLLRTVIVDNAMRFQVTTLGGTDNTPSRFTAAELAAGYFEVRVRYRVP